MSRWESLKSEKGEERERRNNGSGLSRNKRWTSLNSNTTYDSSRQQNCKSSVKGRQQQNRPKRRDENEAVSSSRIDATNNDKLSILIAEYDAIVNSLKSQLFGYQIVEGNNDHDKSVLIEKLLSLLRDTTNISQLSRANEQTYNTDIFMALLDLLKIAAEDEDFDDNGDGDVGFLVAQTIESCLKVSEADVLTKIKLSKSQVEFGITILLSHHNNLSVQPPKIQSPMDSSLLVAIALLIKNHVCELPPESTARRVVGAIFIPYLSSLEQNQKQEQEQEQNQVYQFRSTTTSSSSLAKIKCVCEATIALLQNSSHASAILGPLVEDVCIQFNYGMEEQTINPLRMELLWVLLKCLETPRYQNNSSIRRTEELRYVCRTLSATIDGIRKLKKGNETDINTRNDADLHIIKPLQKFILEVVTEYSNKIRKSSEMVISFENLMVSLLQLLKRLISCYPKAMIGTGWKLIIEGANRSVKSALSHTTGSYDLISPVTSSYLPLLLMIDNSYEITMYRHERESENLALTMDCIANFILILPWNKWLKQSGPGHDKHQGYNTKITPVLTPTKAITSGLYKTVVDALVSLIEISKNAFCKCSDKSLMKSLGRLIKSIMLEIPYCDIKLIRAGEDLWKVIAKTILDSQKYINSSFNKQKQTLACEVLIASSGGTITPQGYLRGMSVPAQTWLLSKTSSSKLFLEGLLDIFESMDDRLDQEVRILSSILRTLPDVALQRWDSFHKIFDELKTSSSIENNSNKKDLMRMEVLESFMLGRKDFDVSADLKTKNDRIITDLDGIMLKRWNQNGLQRCMNIYSAFRSQDWIHLDGIGSRVSSHLDKIFSCCQNSSSKIREGAARAVGEFCTQYIIRDDSFWISIEETKMQQCRLLIYKVHAAMLELCRDQNAGARSMSIFSLGNLASALKGSNAKEILETSRMHEMHKAILCSFNDTNDKVVKNAIRSVGHTNNLLILSLGHGGCDEQFCTSYGLLVETIESLTRKLWNTLHVALNEEQKSVMTWKERSAAKKHGWGACHSLGLVFEGLWVQIFEECNELASACSKAVQCLFLCTCHHTVLNEKVVLAAMAAICHLPRKFLIGNDFQNNVLGDALKISILILESTHDARLDIIPMKVSNNKVATSKLVTQNEKFLLHLLNSALSADAAEVLTDDRITTQTLGILYSWMVERLQLDGLSARAFEIFALALQQPGRWSASIEFEQQFTSRALQKYKQERIGKNSTPAQNRSSPAQNIKDEDEADEL